MHAGRRPAQCRRQWITHGEHDRASTAVHFEKFEDGVEAIRLLSQSGLYPTNCRILDPTEVKRNKIGDGSGGSLLMLGFESADHPLEAWINRVGDNGRRPITQIQIIVNCPLLQSFSCRLSRYANPRKGLGLVVTLQESRKRKVPSIK